MLRQASAAPSLSAPAREGGRLVGLDLARALAFGGMLLAHFAASGPGRAGDPGWLRALDNAADGRAAPLFCALLGVGAGLLAAKGTPDAVFVRRGLVLFALGLAIWPSVDRIYLILPHYGLLLAAIPLLRRLPTRWLVPTAAAAFLLPSLVVAVVDGHGFRAGAQPSSYAELLDAGGLAWHLLWAGGYPVMGWVGFVLVGMWLVRQDLADGAAQVRLLAGGVAVALTQPLIAAVFHALGGWPDPSESGGIAAFFDGSAHSNQLAWYVLASSTAVAAIAACLLLTRRPAAPIRAVVHLGQLAQSAYLAHILLGEVLVWNWLRDVRPPLVTQVAIVVAVFAVFAAAADAWRARYRRGPVEGILRALSG